MNRNKVVVILFLIVLCLGVLPAGTTSAGCDPEARKAVVAPPAGAAIPLGSSAPAGDAASGPTVVLRAATGATIRFWTQNGRTVDGARPEVRDLPHLVLQRNGVLAHPAERTLILEVTGLEVPPPGVTVTLSVETQHGDPDWVGDSPPRIPVWRQSRWIPNSTGIAQTGAKAVFRHTFEARIRSGSASQTTPTDYFRYDLLVTDAGQPGTGPLHVSARDHAFLMENQWIAPLPEVREASPGAAPDELVVYTCDMFPFRRDGRDPATWLPRERVPDYVHSELIPAMVEAFRLQTDDWGFPWYPEWTGYRPGKDEERLTVALAHGEAWFHGRTLGRGNSGIFLNVNGGMVEYETLTDGLMSTFHHELFHNHQRNLQQHLGGSGRVGGAENTWNFIAEGTAVLASSVGQPQVQLTQTWGARQYLSNARGFLGREGISWGDLNKSYERMNAYHAAAYWRFLYEQCGGITDSVEGPAGGMVVIRQVLVTLYSGEVVDSDTTTDLVKHLPGIMDEALQSSSCRFRTHQESLLAFTGAIYALRLEGGRCTGPGSPAGCGFYDPDTLYHNPAVSTITYKGKEITYSAADQPYPPGIPNSFGVDLIEVALDGAVNNKPLTITVHREAGADAVFHVQLWKINDLSVAVRVTAPETPKRTVAGGQLVTVFTGIDTTAYNRLGLVITRLDVGEGTDREGGYTIVLRPDA